jgi:hypothetical protein
MRFFSQKCLKRRMNIALTMFRPMKMKLCVRVKLRVSVRI